MRSSSIARSLTERRSLCAATTSSLREKRSRQSRALSLISRQRHGRDSSASTDPTTTFFTYSRKTRSSGHCSTGSSSILLSRCRRTSSSLRADGSSSSVTRPDEALKSRSRTLSFRGARSGPKRARHNCASRRCGRWPICSRKRLLPSRRKRLENSARRTSSSSRHSIRRSSSKSVMPPRTIFWAPSFTRKRVRSCSALRQRRWSALTAT